MRLAADEAKRTMNADFGGPFGAVILDSEGKILSISSNTVLHDNDPTAHAEMNAIRLACKKLGTHDLSGCTLYTTAYPCPMCLSAIIWANIKEVYYGADKSFADSIGFRDDVIYQFLEGKSVEDDETRQITLCIHKVDDFDTKMCESLFKAYSEESKTMY